MDNTGRKILRIDASARSEGSDSRALGDRLIDGLSTTEAISRVQARDLADGMEFIDQDWLAASAAPEDQRSPEQQSRLALSDALVAELVAADILVITTPIYNFSVPATLKAWVDLVARARSTFRYSEEGSQGLLTDKHAILVITSGGTRIGSELDYVSGYLRDFLGFLGIERVDIIAADGLAEDWPARMQEAGRRIDEITRSRSVA